MKIINMKANLYIYLFTCMIVSVFFWSCDNQIEAVDPGPIPEASFIFQLQANTPGRVSFASTSTGQNQLAWDFGNGSFAYNQDAVTRTYAASGTYYVQLTAINVAGVSTFGDSITIEIPPQLTSEFSVSFDSQQPLTVKIENKSQNAESYQWDFGDGNTSNDANINSYTYQKSGNYTIALRTVAGEEQTPNFRVSFSLIDPAIFHGGAEKIWVFDDSDTEPSYFVERNGLIAFEYTLLSCELNDQYTFSNNRRFTNANEGDARIIQQGGECRQVATPPNVAFSLSRQSNSIISLAIPGSYLGDIDSGPLYNIRSISETKMTLSFTRANPFNAAQNEAVVMILVPQS
jgi:hypothetical protein